jgi:hypothetical protein
MKQDAQFLFKLHLKPGTERGNSVRHADVLQRHKHAGGKRFATDAPLSVAPQARSDVRVPIRGATQQPALVFKVSSSFEMTYEMTGTTDNSECSNKRSQATTERQVSTYRSLWPDHERLVAGTQHKRIRGARTVRELFSLVYHYVKFNSLNAQPILLYLN